MTLLVGVLCTNGIVIAADKQATHGAMGMQTIGQSITKINLVGTDTLFASSGRQGLGQQLEGVVRTKHSSFHKNDYHPAIQEVQKGFRDILDPALVTAHLAARVYGPEVAMDDATCACLLATRFKDGLKLVEISNQASVEYLTPELPFITLGSGKGTADPFLGFLRKVFWPSRSPSVVEAALAAYWTVKHAIDMKVRDVGFDVDVFTLEPKGSAYEGAQLDEAHLKEHEDFRIAAEQRLASLRGELESVSAPGATAPSEPPQLKP